MGVYSVVMGVCIQCGDGCIQCGDGCLDSVVMCAVWRWVPVHSVVMGVCIQCGDECIVW